MSLGEVSNSREFLAPTTDFDDESCSYNDEDPEDRSDATYDVEYPFEGQSHSEIDKKAENQMKEPQMLVKEESCHSLQTPKDVDPDSLVVNSSEEDEEKAKLDGIENDFEPECDFKDKECQFSPTNQSVCLSRASVDSQKSVCFFVDLEEDASTNLMHRVVAEPSRRHAKPYRTMSQSDRMTQSMYVEPSLSRCPSGASISFYVDLNNSTSPQHTSRSSSFLRSNSREESGKDLEEVSEDMQVKSQILMEKSLKRTQVFFGKLKDYIDYLGKPSFSKEELRKKRQMADNITRLMFEEEENLRCGQLLSETQKLEQIVLKGPEKPVQKSNLAKNFLDAPSHHPSKSDEKPVLRRERTFDMDTKMSLKQIPLDSSSNSDHSSDTTQICNLTTNKESKNSPDPVSGLEMFQQQRLILTQKLKKDISKLEKMNQSESSKCPKPKMRQCWVDKNHDSSEKMMSFKDLNKKNHENGRPISSASSVSSSCSWFVPNDVPPPEPSKPKDKFSTKRREASKGIQTGDSLLRQFRERHDKGVYVRERPQAYFLACEEQVPIVDNQNEKKEHPVAKPRTVGIVRSYRARDEHPLVKTTVIDLETEVLPEANNLQEALRRRRPDYIARRQDRDRDRMARSLISNQRKSTGDDLMTRSTTSISQSGRNNSTNRIPLSNSPYLSKNVILKPANQRTPMIISDGKEPLVPAERPSSKSRIPRTLTLPATKSSKPQEGPESGQRTNTRVHEPLQLRGPNTATVYSTAAQDVKQKRRYISNRVA